MYQTLMSSYFSSPKQQKLYVLNLSFDKKRLHKATWYSKHLTESNIVKQIKRPQIITLSIDKSCIDHIIDVNRDEFREINQQHISVLKSNLQKAVRRNLPSVALQSAKRLMEYITGTVHLLRRLCVIILEDKFCCVQQIANHFHLLVWIMATEKTWIGWEKWIFQ